MIKESKNKFTLSKRAIWSIVLAVGIPLFVWFVFSITTAGLGEDESQASGPKQGTATNAGTQFTGDGSGKGDPEAQRMYCEDSKLRKQQLGVGGSIRDMCVLDVVAEKYLPTLTDEQVADLLENQPTCFETGYDDEGYHCFTGFDESGCDRSGLDDSGNACERINQPIANPLSFDKSTMCGLLEDCESEAKFDETGFNKFGCNRQGRKEDGTLCPAEFITPIYDDEGRDQLGFTREGFNEFNCDRQGLRADGTACPLSEVTRVFNRNNRDQFGFDPDGYNAKGCDLDGLRADGSVCAIEDITRVFDPDTGRDQFGFDEDGYNEKKCNAAGFKRDGTRCDLDDITRIVGKDGRDQFGLFSSGLNEHNCDIEGYKPDGSLCPIDQSPRLFSPLTGEDQFGLFPNKRNKFGCDEAGFKADGSLCPPEQQSTRVDKNTGLSINGLSTDGYNNKNCNLQGFTRSGQRCALSDIPRVFADGFDQFGIDKDGYNKANCNAEGFDREGKRCALDDIPRIFDAQTNLDQFGLDPEGYNVSGCDLQGRKRDGSLCNPDDVTRIIDPITGLDQFGLTSAGFSPKTGCNLLGFRVDGSRCSYEDTPKITDADGFNQLGLSEDGRNRYDCDINGRKPNGEMCASHELTGFYDSEGYNLHNKNKGGFDRLSFNDMGYNASGCDINGLKANGEVCDADDLTHVFAPGAKYDQFGLDREGYNSAGCNLKGLNRQGAQCDAADVPRIFGRDMVDQFGNHVNDLPASVWNAQADALERVTKGGQPLFVDGKAAFVGKDGYLVDVQGNPILDANGERIRMTASGELANESGDVLSPARLTDAQGKVLSGPLGKAKGLVSKVVPLSKGGQSLFVDGKRAFMGKDGYLVDAQGNPLLDKNGERIKMNASGELVNESGQLIAASRMTDASGNRLTGKISADAALPGVGSPLLKGGEALFVDGKQAFVGKDGFLVDAQGNPLLDENGERIRMNASGELVNESGKVIDASRLTNSQGRVLSGPVSVASGKAATGSPLLKGGEALFVDGKQAFVGKDGFLVDAQGNPLLDENGERIRMNASGELVNESGKVIDDSRLTNARGERLAGKVTVGSSLPGVGARLLKGDEALFVDGKQAFVGKDGFLVDAQGNPLLDENGERIRMNASGELVNESGKVIDDSRLTDARGERLAGKVTVGSSLPGVGARLLKGDEALFVDGKQAFVGKDGFLVDAQGNPLLDENGERIRMNASGELVNESGKVIDDSRLTNSQGKRLSGSLSVETPSIKAASPLLKGGKIAHINGKAAFVGDDGYLVDAQGDFLRDANGQKLRLNDLGQVVNESGRVLQDAAFTDAQGNVLTGGISTGRPMTESEIENKLLSDAISPELKQRLGLNDAGFNAAGCGLNGLRADGSLCNPANIPRLYDADTGLDQLGFGQDGYNEYGCDFYGKNRQGEMCAPEHITRVVGKDGYDQFGEDAAGFLRSGLNRRGENALGCDAAGNNCSKKQAPKLRDAAGVDQFHERADGRDRLGLKNGFNDKGCGLDGLNRRGEHCAQEDIPRLTLADGKDQFGLIDGYNEHGCSLEGLRRDGTRCPRDKTPLVFNAQNFDQFGFDPEGFNDKACDINGLRRDGSVCDLKDITRLVDPQTGLDQLGLDDEGFNAAGCNLKGVDRNGNVCAAENIPRQYSLATGLDQFGLDPDGYNVNGCDLRGRKRDGTLCDINDVTRITGEDGRDQFGFDDTMRNEYGCDFYGYDRQGKLCEQSQITRVEDATGKDQFGVDVESGMNEHGCNLNDRTAAGDVCPPKFQVKFKKKDGKDRFGMADGRNAKGCDINGLKADGTRCAQEDVTRVVDPETGRDQFGLDGNLRNEHGCDVSGLDNQGNPCRPDQLTHLYDANDTDQFGLLKDGYSEAGCNLLGMNKQGQPCARENIVSIRGANGINQLGLDRLNLDEDGFDLRRLNIDGCDENNRKADGTACEKYASSDLDPADEQYIAARKQAMAAWLAAQTAATQPVPIGEGTYVAEQDPLFIKPEPIVTPAVVVNNEGEIKEEGATIENGGQNGVVEIPLGLMARVRIDTPINSDYMDGRSVYGTFVGGELDGARLRGNISVPYINDNVMPRDKFSYVFDTIIYNRKEYPITATSINVTNDSGMVDADDVDYHRFQRYGGLLVATAMQAAQATFLDGQVESDIERQASMIEAAQQQVLMYGQNSREIGKENAKIATKHAVDIAQEQFNRRPTLTKGRSMQLIIFTSSVENDELPVMYDGSY